MFVGCLGVVGSSGEYVGGNHFCSWFVYHVKVVLVQNMLPSDLSWGESLYCSEVCKVLMVGPDCNLVWAM